MFLTPKYRKLGLYYIWTTFLPHLHMNCWRRWKGGEEGWTRPPGPAPGSAAWPPAPRAAPPRRDPRRADSSSPSGRPSICAGRSTIWSKHLVCQASELEVYFSLVPKIENWKKSCPVSEWPARWAISLMWNRISAAFCDLSSNTCCSHCVAL
jgi:hypothetical protein